MVVRELCRDETDFPTATFRTIDPFMPVRPACSYAITFQIKPRLLRDRSIGGDKWSLILASSRGSGSIPFQKQ
jgi:hypothetical protein